MLSFEPECARQGKVLRLIVVQSAVLKTSRKMKLFAELRGIIDEMHFNREVREV